MVLKTFVNKILHYKYNHWQKYIFKKCNFCLGDFLDKNEKTKVIIKTASLKSGQPWREPLLSEKDQNMLLMHSAKRREGLIALAKNSDDSYHDAPWANQGGLKQKMLGMDNISWKPGQF